MGFPKLKFGTWGLSEKGTSRRCQLYLHSIFKATPERLIMHLIEEHSIVDPTYIEDFLLTYRTFLTSPLEVGNKLLEWFTVDSLRDKVGSSLRAVIHRHGVLCKVSLLLFCRMIAFLILRFERLSL